jgi:MFS family permease
MQVHDNRFQESSERWTVLLISCSILWCLLYCYDIPSVVHDDLEEYTGLSKTDFPWFFNALYAAYSLPNLILPLIFGFFSDTNSVCLLIILLATTSCIGQGLFLLGLKVEVPWLSVCSRFIFGIGCESLGVSLSSVLTHVFEGKEVAFALAVSISFARLGMIRYRYHFKRS